MRRNFPAVSNKARPTRKVTTDLRRSGDRAKTLVAPTCHGLMLRQVGHRPMTYIDQLHLDRVVMRAAKASQ